MRSDVATVSHWNQHHRRSCIIRRTEFVSRVQDTINERRSQEAHEVLGRVLQVEESIFQRAIYEDLLYKLKSYIMNRGQFLSDRTRKNHLIKAKHLLSKVKHLQEPGMLWFFSDDRMCAAKNDRCLFKTYEEIPTIIHAMFPVSMVVLVSSDGNVISPYFFLQETKSNAVAYTVVLNTVVKPWITAIAWGRPYVFQQDSTLSHTTQ